MIYKELANGLKMPILGLGTFKIEPDVCEQIVYKAINDYGYRLIDTAQAYFNETAIGNAIKKANVKRSELFITTKVWISNYGYNNTIYSIEKSLKNLQTNYIDLVLIHQPFNDYYASWKALETLYKKGIIKAIGVSNFEPDRLVDLCLYSEIKPVINQIELHVLRQRKVDLIWNKKYDVAIQSYSSFGRGIKDLLTIPKLVEIANKYQKTVAQIILRWLIQLDIFVIPKTITESRLKENIDVFNFELQQEDMNTILSLDENKCLFNYHPDPAAVEHYFEIFPKLKR